MPGVLIGPIEMEQINRHLILLLCESEARQRLAERFNHWNRHAGFASRDLLSRQTVRASVFRAPCCFEFHRLKLPAIKAEHIAWVWHIHDGDPAGFQALHDRIVRGVFASSVSHLIVTQFDAVSFRRSTRGSMELIQKLHRFIAQRLTRLRRTETSSQRAV